MAQLSRRRLLWSSAAAFGSLCVERSPLAALTHHQPGRLPAPDKSGIEHVIVAMMENRSFDHLLGWLPGAGGRQAGLVYKDSLGRAFETHELAPDFQGCSHPDPDHSYAGGRTAYNDGLCDGWLRAGSNDLYAIGYYTRPDLPFLGKAAPDWTVCNRYFASIMAPTYPNRLYMHCAVTDRLDDSLGLTTLPTIWDRLDDAGVDGRYYRSDTSFLDLWGSRYAGRSLSYAQFLADCATGDLPAVAFVDPPFQGEAAGTSADDHAHGDLRAGEWWLYQTYLAVTRNPDWKHTVLVIPFDEWGGFFDHVVPPMAPDVDPAFELRGFRVPCLIVSPFSPPNTIATGVFDHTSILKLIEWRWNIPALSVRDDAANNLALALDFDFTRRHVLDYGVPELTSLACPGG